MSDIVTALPLLDTGVTGLLVLVFLAVIAGYLIPKKRHEAEVAIWRQVAESRMEDNRQLIGYVAKMLPLAETSAHILKSMSPEGDGSHDGHSGSGPRGGGDSNG